MAATLTQRQQQVLQFLLDYTTAEGRPPTVREIGKHLNIRSTNGVQCHLRALAAKGHLTWQHHSPRGLRLVGAPAVRPTIRRQGENLALQAGPLTVPLDRQAARELAEQILLALGEVA